MATRLVLHVGLQKSGTTYLQEVLTARAGELASAGVLYPLPSDRRRKRRTENHEWASYGLLGPEYPWVSDKRAAEERDSWKALEKQVARAPGTVLLSAEALSTVRTPAIRRLLDRLAVPDVEVVVTARSLSRSLPSLWQQHVRNGRRLGFERYLGMLEEQRGLPPERVEEEADLHLWRAFALGRLVRRWAAETGIERVRVVTSPGSPPHLLWARFCEAIGVPALAARKDEDEVVDRPVHTGMTAAEASVMVSLNVALERANWARQPANRLREAVITEGFHARSSRGPRVAIPPAWSERVAQWAKEDNTELLESGVGLIGDTADLAPARDDVRPPTPEEIGAAGAAAVVAAARKDGWDRT